MQITGLPATPLVLPGGSTIRIATQRWTLEPWTGDLDPPDLKKQWGVSRGFAVSGRRSCAELAVPDHLRHDFGRFRLNPFGVSCEPRGIRPQQRQDRR